MNSSVVYLVLFMSILIAFLVFVVFLLRYNQKFLMESQKQYSEVLKSTLQQTIALLGTKDPLAYQAIMAMENRQFSMFEAPGMSDEEEAERWSAAHPNGVTDNDSVKRDLADYV